MAGLPPPPLQDAQGSFGWLEWYRQLRDYLSTASSIPWNIIQFAGSKLTDIQTRLHGDLQAIQGGVPGERYHLTAAQVAAIGTVNTNYFTFDTTPTGVPTTTPGTLYWDEADGNQTLSLVMANGATTQQIGQEQYYRIKATATITNGQVIMFTGSVGASGGLTGAPATGLLANTASYVMGVATEDIAHNGWGYITSFGLVRGINTTGGAEAWVDGQILYLDPTVAGGLTKSPPVAPNPKVIVAAATHAAVNGSLFIRPTFGGKLGDYEGDVQVTTPIAKNILEYDGTVWKNVANNPTLPYLQTPTINQLADWFNTSSSGQVSGGIISATGTQIEVTAGEGMIKSGAAITDPTFFCEWAAVPLTTVTDARMTWVCVDYNSGNPAILFLETTTADEPAAVNYNSCWPLGYVVREGSVVHVTNNPRKMQDVTGSLIRRFRQTLPLARDERVGGLMIGETGTRNISLTAGYLFDRQNRFPVAALNTAVSGTFDRYYRDAGSGFTREAAQTQWPNTQYDNGSGALVTMTNNWYANLYWYLELDGNLIMIYGRSQYSSASAAELESLPATVPLRILADGRIISRTTFQKSAATFVSINSAFTNTFSASAASTHNNLAGLQGGTASEYYHLTSAEYTGTGTNAIVRQTSPVTKTADFTLAATENWVINNKASACVVTLPSAATFAGRSVTFQNYQAFTLTSASSNVVPQGGGAAGTAILLGVVGNWATLVSDGTNWVIMQAAPNNILLLE